MTTVTFKQPSLKTLDFFLDNLLNETPASKKSTFNFPPVNIFESNDNYELEINAAGRKKEDFKITVDKNILTVSFEKNEEKNEGQRHEGRRGWAVDHDTGIPSPAGR